jgi:hypothetical protein
MATTSPSSRRFSAVSAWLLAAAALGALGGIGCGGSGPALGKVSGKVSFQGKPLTEGTITFASQEKGPTITAKIGPDGAYRVKTAKGEGLPPGRYEAWISPPVVELPVGMVKEMPKPREYPEIPAKYRQARTSGLTLTVEQGDNTLDVDMQP